MQLHQKSPKVAMVESNIQHKFSFNHRILFYMLFLALAFLSDLNHGITYNILDPRTRSLGHKCTRSYLYI